MRKNIILTPEEIQELKEQERLERRAEKNTAVTLITNVVKFNMFLIRELYGLIANEESSIEIFKTDNGKEEKYKPVNELSLYLFLDTLKDTNTKGNKLKRCRDKYDHMLSKTPFVLNDVSHKLIDCGISSQYVTASTDIKKIKLDDDIEQLIEDYFSTLEEKREQKREQKENESLNREQQNINQKDEFFNNISDVKSNDSIPKVILKQIHSCLKNNYNKIYNLDGSLLIDSIKCLVLESKKYIADRDLLSEIGVEISNIQLENYYTNISVKKIYSHFAKCLADEKSEIPVVNPIDKKKVNTIKKETENISWNFFIIKELYLLLSELENIKNALNKFYSILSITKKDYETIIKTGTVTDYDIINKLVKFNFPASMFRNEKPSLLPMRKNLEYIIQEYFVNKNLDEFHSKLKLEIIYTNYEENAVLFMLVYNILKAVIEEEDTFWSDLVTKYPDLLTKEFKL